MKLVCPISAINVLALPRLAASARATDYGRRIPGLRTPDPGRRITDFEPRTPYARTPHHSIVVAANAFAPVIRSSTGKYSLAP